MYRDWHCLIQRLGIWSGFYDPENGEPILNPDFQNWNYLVLNMIAWLENETTIEEFTNEQYGNRPDPFPVLSVDCLQG